MPNREAVLLGQLEFDLDLRIQAKLLIENSSGQRLATGEKDSEFLTWHLLPHGPGTMPAFVAHVDSDGPSLSVSTSISTILS